MAHGTQALLDRSGKTDGEPPPPKGLPVDVSEIAVFSVSSFNPTHLIGHERSLRIQRQRVKGNRNGAEMAVVIVEFGSGVHDRIDGETTRKRTVRSVAVSSQGRTIKHL